MRPPGPHAPTCTCGPHSSAVHEFIESEERAADPDGGSISASSPSLSRRRFRRGAPSESLHAHGAPGNRAGDGRGRGCRTGGDVVGRGGGVGVGRAARRRRAPRPPRRRRAGAPRVVQGGVAGRGAACAAPTGGDGVARRRRHVGLPPRLQVRQARRLRRLLHPPVSNPNPVPALSPLRINAGHSHLSAVIVLVSDSCCPLYP